MSNTVYKRVVRILVVCLIIALFAECETRESGNNRVSVIDHVTQSKRLKNLMTSNSIQKFSINGADLVVVRGSHGTEITVDPEDLESDVGGDLAGKEINLELIELVDQSDLARAVAQTVSNGELLVSGGAYWINITSGSENVKIKNGKSIKVRFPQFSGDEMSLFYGQRDSLGLMNWEATDVTLSQGDNGSVISELVDEGVDPLEDTDTLYDDDRTRKVKQKIRLESRKNQTIEGKLYQAIEIKKLGWINVDRFYEMTNNKDFLLAFNPRDSVTSAIVYMIFEDINSVLTTTYFAVNDSVINNVFKNIPGEGRVKLIGVTLKDEEIFASQQIVDLRSEVRAEFKMEKTSEERLADLFN